LFCQFVRGARASYFPILRSLVWHDWYSSSAILFPLSPFRSFYPYLLFSSQKLVMMPKWEPTQKWADSQPGLSRCSTLVSEQDFSHTFGAKAEPEKCDIVEFHDSFLKKFGHAYSFEDAEHLTVARNRRTTTQDSLSSQARLSRAVVNGWACKSTLLRSQSKFNQRRTDLLIVL
jgi:hypothetical protein